MSFGHLQMTVSGVCPCGAEFSGPRNKKRCEKCAKRYNKAMRPKWLAKTAKYGLIKNRKASRYKNV